MTGIESAAVVGAGAWGTALAIAAARAGLRVTLLGRDGARTAAMAQSRRNPRLPGIDLPAGMHIGSVAEGAVAEAGLVILAVPMQASAAAAAALAGRLRPGTPLVGAAKGIERGSGRFLGEIVASVPGARPAILSGPGFAEDVARGLPTALTVAAEEAGLAEALAQALASPAFRLYHTRDVRGVEIGGAAKNVLAIACGIAHGRGLGASASAALVSRAFAELSRFARSYGASPETLTGLSGLGDLVLTATSPQSRNFSLGVRIGRGVAMRDALAAGLAEGAPTAAILVRLAEARGIDMPIAAAVSGILDGRLGVDSALRDLLARPIRAEIDGGTG